MFGIEEALKDLGLKNDNNGTSTGVDEFGNGKKISSYSRNHQLTIFPIFSPANI